MGLVWLLSKPGPSWASSVTCLWTHLTNSLGQSQLSLRKVTSGPLLSALLPNSAHFREPLCATLDQIAQAPGPRELPGLPLCTLKHRAQASGKAIY